MAVAEISFSEGTERVLAHSQEEARRLGHYYVSTEHFLLALSIEKEMVLILSLLGVDPQKLIELIESIIGRGINEITGDILLTPRAKKVVELAIMAARERKHPAVSPPHLLFAILRDTEGIVANILATMGVDLEKAHRLMAAFLGGMDKQELSKLIHRLLLILKSELEEVGSDGKPIPELEPIKNSLQAIIRLMENHQQL